MSKKKFFSKEWRIWYAAVFIFLVLLLQVASSMEGTKVTLLLEQNQEVHWTVWRPLTTGTKGLDIGFKAELPNGMRRQDMGNWESIRNKETLPGEYLFKRPRWFDDPGEPVWLDVTLNGKTCTMKALPDDNKDFQDGYIWRGLLEDGGDSNIYQQFGGNQRIACDFIETFGWNKWSVKINRINSNLAGETVFITTDRPMSWKFVDHNYYYLAEFGFFYSPFIGLFLLIWGIYLAWISYRNRNKRNSDIS